MFPAVHSEAFSPKRSIHTYIHTYIHTNIHTYKALLKAAKSQSRYENKFNGFNDYFIIDDRKEVVDLMEMMNANRKGGGRKKVSTYDFSTLYTSIPHDKLKEKMKEFINRIFQKKDKSFVISSYRTVFD